MNAQQLINTASIPGWRHLTHTTTISQRAAGDKRLTGLKVFPPATKRFARLLFPRQRGQRKPSLSQLIKTNNRHTK